MADQYTAYPPNAPAAPFGAAPNRAVDPIISRLRPRDVLGILDQSFRIYRRHFLTFLAIIAVVHVPIQLLIQLLTAAALGSTFDQLNALSAQGSRNAGSSSFNELFINQFLFMGGSLILGLIYTVLMSFSQGALTAGVKDSYLENPVGFGRSYRETFRHIGPLLGLMLLQFLLQIAPFLPLLAIILPFSLASMGSLLGGSDSAAGGLFATVCLGFLLAGVAFIVYLYIMVRIQLVVPALIIENLGPVQSIKRSWGLVKNYWWRTAGLAFLLWIISVVVSAGPAALVAGIVAILVPRDFVLSQTISGVVTVLVTMIYIPIQLIAVTLYYFDLRVRREGFDLETAMSHAYPQYGQYPQYPQYPQYGQPTQPSQQPQYGQPPYGYDGGEQARYSPPPDGQPHAPYGQAAQPYPQGYGAGALTTPPGPAAPSPQTGYTPPPGWNPPPQQTVDLGAGAAAAARENPPAPESATQMPDPPATQEAPPETQPEESPPGAQPSPDK